MEMMTSTVIRMRRLAFKRKQDDNSKRKIKERIKQLREDLVRYSIWGVNDPDKKYEVLKELDVENKKLRKLQKKKLSFLS
jgi:hypothetical protein